MTTEGGSRYSKSNNITPPNIEAQRLFALAGMLKGTFSIAVSVYRHGITFRTKLEAREGGRTSSPQKAAACKSLLSSL